MHGSTLSRPAPTPSVPAASNHRRMRTQPLSTCTPPTAQTRRTQSQHRHIHPSIGACRMAVPKSLVMSRPAYLVMRSRPGVVRVSAWRRAHGGWAWATYRPGESRGTASRRTPCRAKSPSSRPASRVARPGSWSTVRTRRPPHPPGRRSGISARARGVGQHRASIGGTARSRPELSRRIQSIWVCPGANATLCRPVLARCGPFIAGNDAATAPALC
jgi:hypothetical protein